MSSRKNKGLSLLELIIVIAILGVLALLSIFFASTQLERARDAKRKADITNIRNGLEQYYDTTHCYPQTLQSCGGSLSQGTDNYLYNIPCDPKTSKPYMYVSDGSACSSSFQVYSTLEIKDDKAISYVGCTYGCGPQCKYNYGASSPNQSLTNCPGPTNTPAPTRPPTPTNSPTPTPLQYVCAPGGGSTGSCEVYAYPTMSLCPTVYPNDPTCGSNCSDPKKRCKNASGKYK